MKTNGMEKTNENYLDVYLSDRFKGKALTSINKFLCSLYDDYDWKACFFQKKPPAYKKTPDTYWMLTNSAAKVCIVVKVNEIRDNFIPFFETENHFIMRPFEAKNFRVECVYSKPIFFDIHNMEEAVNGINSILGD
jgi:hypothetical protein